MEKRKGFFATHLDPGGIFGEILFGLIMVLTFTLGAGLTIKEEGPEAVHGLLIAALGCNIAWGIIDGVMYIMGCLLDRGRRNRMLVALKDVTDEAVAMAAIESEMDGPLTSLLAPAERQAAYRDIWRLSARAQPERTRIQAENEERILDAALEVFSRYGFRGATVDQIAEKAGMSKPNLLYYFRRKHDLYTAVLTRTLDMWLTPFGEMAEDGDPETELTGYIRQKLEASRDFPQESRLFIGEILQGAPHLEEVLNTDLKSLVAEKAGVLNHWIASGRLRPIDPVHLIFMIWATTQHYADFDAQIKLVLGKGVEDPATFQKASSTVIDVLMGGILPR